jgi:hypothetical protein
MYTGSTRCNRCRMAGFACAGRLSPAETPLSPPAPVRPAHHRGRRVIKEGFMAAKNAASCTIARSAAMRLAHLEPVAVRQSTSGMRAAVCNPAASTVTGRCTAKPQDRRPYGDFTVTGHPTPPQANHQGQQDQLRQSAISRTCPNDQLRSHLKQFLDRTT